MINILRTMLRKETGWVRVHAADALTEHGVKAEVAAVYAPLVDAAPPPDRIGVWRSMTRSAPDGKSRRQHIQRVRRVMLDEKATDRVTAAETIAKLNAGDPADLPALWKWIESTGDSDAAMALWLIAITGDAPQRRKAEARLAHALRSTDPIARQRAAFSLGRMETICPASVAEILRRTAEEPADSPARVFVFIAALLHDPAGPRKWADTLRRIVKNGPAADQLHAAIALGQRGDESDLALLEHLAKTSGGDPAIGGADGWLRLAKRIGRSNPIARCYTDP